MNRLNGCGLKILSIVIITMESSYIFAATSGAGNTGSSSSSQSSNNATGINPNNTSDPTANPASLPPLQQGTPTGAPTLPQQSPIIPVQTVNPANSNPNNTGGVGINNVPPTQPQLPPVNQTTFANPNGTSNLHLSNSQIRYQVRSALNNDKALPNNTAGGIQVITINHRVILKGTVATTQEKQEIAAQAGQIVGMNNVTNNLTVQ